MTFDRSSLSTDYLVISRMLRELKLKKWNYDEGTSIRETIDNAIKALEHLKCSIGVQIDKDGV